MEVKLNNTQILKAIALYRERELIWNMSIPAYRRNDLKNKAFDVIANEMHLPVDLLKKNTVAAINIHRGVEEVQQGKMSRSATEEAYVPSVFWFQEMHFLDGSIVLRKSVDNSNLLICDASSDLEKFIEEDVVVNTSQCSISGLYVLEKKIPNLTRHCRSW